MNYWMLIFLGAVALVLTVVGVGYVADNPGYILIAFGDTRVELTLWAGLLLLLLATALLYVIVLLLKAPLRGVRQGRQALVGSRARRHEQRATSGVVAYVEGHWEQARKILSPLAEDKQSPPTSQLTYNLMSARASHALGDDRSAEQYLHAAEEHSTKADFAVGLTQAEMQVDRGQLEGALATLMRVRAVSSQHPAALKLLAQVHRGLGDWAQVRKLLPELRKAHVFDSGELLTLERESYGALLRECGQGQGGGLAELEKAWKVLPRSLEDDPELASEYAEQLLALGQGEKAEHFLRHALGKSWDSDLIGLYGKIPGGDAAARLAQAEAWLTSRGESASLLLAAGRLALANRDWEKARAYFEGSLKMEQNPEAYAELGRLLSSLGDQDSSVKMLQRGLVSSTGELPNLPLPPRPAPVAVPPPSLAGSAGTPPASPAQA